MVKRNTYIYIKTLEVALADDVITQDEDALLRIIRQNLGLTKSATTDYETKLREGKLIKLAEGEEEKLLSMRDAGDHEVYRKVVVEALADETITKDEMAILNCLRKVYHIEEKEHNKLVSEVEGVMKEKFSGNMPEEMKKRLNMFVRVMAELMSKGARVATDGAKAGVVVAKKQADMLKEKMAQKKSASKEMDVKKSEDKDGSEE